MKLDQALQKFLLQLDADGRSIHTRKQYERHVRLLDRWLRSERYSRQIDEVDHEVLAKFLCSPAARCRPDRRPKKATSANALRTSIRCFFDYLHKAGRIRSNPARLVRRAICSPPPPRALSDDEQRRLLQVLADADGEKARRDHVLFATMLGTGIRVGSVVALDIEHVDLDRGEIQVGATKGNAPTTVFMSDAVRKHLRLWIGNRLMGPLFPGHCGRRLTARHVARRLRTWSEKARIRSRVSPHQLRHSFAMGVYRRTGDLLLVKAALRHRSVASTVIYATASEDRLRDLLRA